MQNSEYRRFNIDGITGGRRLRRHAPGADAPLRQAGRGAGRRPAMAQAARRRALRLPDLVLVDGGKAARWRWRARCSRAWGWTCR
jgi:excinuclease ABC subunit C